MKIALAIFLDNPSLHQNPLWRGYLAFKLNYKVGSPAYHQLKHFSFGITIEINWHKSSIRNTAT